MRNIKISRELALTVIGILLLWFLVPRLFFSAGEQDYKNTITAYEQQVSDRKEQVKQSIESLLLEDTALKQCLERLAMERARIHPTNSGGIDDVRELKNVYCPRQGIRSIAGIDALQDMRFLDISNNHIADISPLSGLTSLKSLHLSGNPIDNILPLQDLVSLREVGLPTLKSLKCTEVERIIENVKTNLSATDCEKTTALSQNQNSQLSETPYTSRRTKQADPFKLTPKEEQELLDYELESKWKLE